MSLCSYCRKARAVHDDHIMSKALRRRFTAWENVTVPACGPCNWRKLSRRLVPVGYPRLEELRILTGKAWMEWDGEPQGAEVVLI